MHERGSQSHDGDFLQVVIRSLHKLHRCTVPPPLSTLPYVILADQTSETATFDEPARLPSARADSAWPAGIRSLVRPTDEREAMRTRGTLTMMAQISGLLHDEPGARRLRTSDFCAHNTAHIKQTSLSPEPPCLRPHRVKRNIPARWPGSISSSAPCKSPCPRRPSSGPPQCLHLAPPASTC